MECKIYSQQYDGPLPTQAAADWALWGVAHSHAHTLPALCHATPECCRLSVTRRTRGSVGWPRHGSCSCGPLWSPRQTWGHTRTYTQHFTCYSDVFGQEKYSQYSPLNFFSRWVWIIKFKDFCSCHFLSSQAFVNINSDTQAPIYSASLINGLDAQQTFWQVRKLSGVLREVLPLLANFSFLLFCRDTVRCATSSYSSATLEGRSINRSRAAVFEPRSNVKTSG